MNIAAHFSSIQLCSVYCTMATSMQLVMFQLHPSREHPSPHAVHLLSPYLWAPVAVACCSPWKHRQCLGPVLLHLCCHWHDPLGCSQTRPVPDTACQLPPRRHGSPDVIQDDNRWETHTCSRALCILHVALLAQAYMSYPCGVVQSVSNSVRAFSKCVLHTEWPLQVHHKQECPIIALRRSLPWAYMHPVPLSHLVSVPHAYSVVGIKG